MKESARLQIQIDYNQSIIKDINRLLTEGGSNELTEDSKTLLNRAIAEVQKQNNGLRAEYGKALEHEAEHKGAHESLLDSGFIQAGSGYVGQFDGKRTVVEVEAGQITGARFVKTRRATGKSLTVEQMEELKRFLS